MTAQDRDPELSAALRAEYRAERREDERVAVRHAWRSRRLIDVAAEAMRRGDQVSVHLPGRSVSGAITSVGEDFAVVHSTCGSGQPRRFHDGRLPVTVVHFPAGAPGPLLQVSARARAGGVQQAPGPKTFLAALRTYQTDQDLDPRGRRCVELGTLAQELVGHLEAVAVDHVFLRARQGTDWYIPTTSVTYVAWAQAQ